MNKPLTVGELINSLKKFNRDTCVLCHDHLAEATGTVDKLWLELDRDRASYKGDHPLDYECKGETVLVIGNRGGWINDHEHC